MGRISFALTCIAVLICSTGNNLPAHPLVGVTQPDGVTRVTDAATVQKLGLPPLNTENKATDLTMLYCKQYALSPDGRLLIVNGVWGGYLAMFDAVTLKFLQCIPRTTSNGMTLGNNPVWDPNAPGCLIYQDGGGVYRATWNKPETRTLIAPPLAGMLFCSNGGEADMDAAGKFYAVKMYKYLNAQGQPQGVRCGVVDIANKRLLAGTILGNPNALDVSPSGKYLAYLDHMDFAAKKPNRLYPIADLATSNTATFIDIPTNQRWGEVNGVGGIIKSMGHNGWSAGPGDVLVYQENLVEDVICAFTPATGAIKKLFPYGAGTIWGVAIGSHFGRTGPAPGYAVMSTYNTPNQQADGVYLINVATGEFRLQVKTHNIHRDYFSEGFAGVTRDGKWAYWQSNWAGEGGDWHLDVYRAPLSAGPVVTPTPTPSATPTQPPPLPPTGQEPSSPIVRYVIPPGSTTSTLEIRLIRP